MKLRLLIPGMALALALASCGADESGAGRDARLPINFNVSVDGAATRAAATTNLKGYTFHVWADMVDNKTSEVTTYLNAWEQNIDGYGNITHASKQFPVYNTLNFYAFLGNIEEPIYGGSTLWPASLHVSVKSTQVTQSDYQHSDLLYAVKTGVIPTSEAVPLHFYHLFSQVEVALMARNQMNDDAILSLDATKVTVSIVGTKLAAVFTPSKTATLTTDAGRLALLTLDDDSEGTIEMETVTTSDFTNSNCAAAVVVPQTVNGQFIKLSYMGHDTYYSVDNLELKSGYRYRFNFVVDRIGETFVVNPSLTVAPWADEVEVAADLNNLTGTTEL